MSGIRWNNVPGNPRGIADAVASVEPLKDAWKSLTGAATDAIKGYETRKTDEHTNAYLQALEQIRNTDQLQSISTQDALNKIYQESNGLIDGTKTRGAYDKRLDTLTSFARDADKHKMNIDDATARLEQTKVNTARAETNHNADKITLAAAEQKQKMDNAFKEITGIAWQNKDVNSQAAIDAMDFLRKNPAYASNYFTADANGNPVINTAAAEQFRKQYLDNPAALQAAPQEVRELFDALGKASAASSDTVYINDAIEKYAEQYKLSPGEKAQLIQQYNSAPETYALQRINLGGDAIAEKQAQAEATAQRSINKRFSFTGGTPENTSKELTTIREFIDKNRSRINVDSEGASGRMLSAATDLMNGFTLPDGRKVFPNAEVIMTAMDRLDYTDFGPSYGAGIFITAPDKQLKDIVKEMYKEGLTPEEQEKLKQDYQVEAILNAGGKSPYPY